MFVLGKTTIQKVHELDLNQFTLAQLLPNMNPDMPEEHPEWIPPGTISAGCAMLSVHAWLLHHEGSKILVDTGAGNDKARPQQMLLDHLQNPFLERLNALGTTPEEIDYVLHTHIHSDHVGWNTRLVGDRWVPTFPNATHLCSDLEWNYGEALADGDMQSIASCRARAGLGEPVRVPVSGTFNDSMRPLQETGQIRRIQVDGQKVLPGIRFLSTAGHSIDHAAIELVSEGQRAIFIGDVMHHPVELYDTELVSVFCEFPQAARRARRFLLERAADAEALCLTAHFSRSSAGRVSRKGDSFDWSFEADL